MTPGDEVVCVGVQDCPNCRGIVSCPPGYVLPVPGRHYIVAIVDEGVCTECGFGTPAMYPAGDGHGLDRKYGWPCHWFRRLDHDDDQIGIETRELEPA